MIYTNQIQLQNCANKNINQLKNNINTSLDNMANWLKANKLTLNVDKSKQRNRNTKKMCHFLQEDTLVSLFNAFVKLYVDYGNLRRYHKYSSFKTKANS